MRLLKHEAGVEAFFLKGSSDETVTVSYDPVTRNLTVVQKTKLDELMDKIKAATKDCDKLDGEAFSDCVSDVILKDIAKLTESKELMIGYRDVMADRLRNYVCQDPAVENSNSTSKTSYVDTSKKSFSSSNYLDTNHAKIWVIDDFVSEEECASLIAAHRASSLVPVNNTLVGHHKIPASTSTDSIRLQFSYKYICIFHD